MIKAGQLAKGMFMLFKNEPHLVADREFVSPGKGSAFVRLKLKNVRTGLVMRETIKTQESVEDVTVDTREAQYLYDDDENYYFMDSESFEQFSIPLKGLEDRKNYMIEGETFQVVDWEGQPLDIKLPFKMAFTVEQAEEAVKGDTVSGTTKLVTLQTGYRVKVPIFIKQGEKILINTETGEYVERVN
jgi:elongation factor P